MVTYSVIFNVLVIIIMLLTNKHYDISIYNNTTVATDNQLLFVENITLR